VTIAGADPMNLMGIVLPGERVAAVPGRSFEYREGTETPSRAILNELRQVLPRRKRPVAPHVPPAVMDQPERSLRLF